MKIVIIAILSSGTISAPALAAGGSDLADADLVFSMDNSQSMQPAVLSPEEMKETDGAWMPNAIGGSIGFITGNHTCLVNSAFN